MALGDDVERMASILVRLHQLDGRAKALRLKAFGVTNDGIGQVAKLVGASREMVAAWEDGRAQPTTNQALTWLGTLYERVPTHTARARAAEVGRSARMVGGKLE